MKRQTVFFSENLGPGDQNFQDQNSGDSSMNPETAVTTLFEMYNNFKCPTAGPP